MPYQPIENYGVIGNMRSAALVGMNGSIDWYCFPAFDSPSVFGALLDEGKGGTFSIAPATEHAAKKQFYWPDTNVLVTRFLSPDGVGQITDFMPVKREGERGFEWLVRRVSVSRGTMPFRAVCRPAFDYARATHQVERVEGGVSFRSPKLTLEMITEAPIRLDDGSVTSEFSLSEGESRSFVLRPADGAAGGPVSDQEASALFEATVDFWRRWLSSCTYFGRWREIVHRSALALKLLSYEPTGAMVAAVTCSLPEQLGGQRNWDYRYMWIRDAAFTMYALMRIGFVEEAGHFMKWLDARCRELGPDGSLKIMYAIDGRPMTSEETLDHLDGYKGSRPVRIGNGAYSQLQLDVYGELLDSVYLYNKYGSPISDELWQHLRRMTNWVCDHWQETDESIWEVRGGRQHFVYSKLMCWVALDRALRLMWKRSFPSDWERWMEVRDRIYADIMKHGWSEKRQAFVQAYGSETLDASALVMPLVFFMSPTDPRMLSTIDAINRSPAVGGLVSNSLVYRYDSRLTADGMRTDEGTFNICTFWLVDAMLRGAGRTDRRRIADARLIFEQMLGYANHLGLFSEQTGPSGEHLGNFPQAFTHLGLISAASNLDRALGERRPR
jgi:GH15 family glucan-1,4-alpha-glucosidase